jgi:putative ABC transport system permease protein
MTTDVAAALRGLRKSPGFALVAVLTLALGIGANTTMFSVVNAVLLRPLPGYQTGRLVRILDAQRGGLGFIDPEAYRQIRAQAHSLEQVAGLQFCPLSLTGLGEPEQLWGPCATANWFEMQHAQAMLGRTFLPDEDQHGRGRVVVLDHGFWTRRFGGDPKIVGRTITLDKRPWMVIGVMPRDFKPLGATDAAIYTPFVYPDNDAGLLVTARLKPGVSLDAAQAEMRVIASRLAASNPDWKNIQLRISPALEPKNGS